MMVKRKSRNILTVGLKEGDYFGEFFMNDEVLMDIKRTDFEGFHLGF
jgi:hypothetical protein